MSNYEWEHGTFKLPSAEFAAFRQAMQDVDRARKEKAFAITQEFWKGLTRKQQTDQEAYRKALSDWSRAKWDAEPRYAPGQRINWSTVKVPDPVEESAEALAVDMLERKANGWASIDGRWQPDPNAKPSRVLASEMNYPTNRSTAFDDEDCTVSFDKDAKTVTWSVPENNHAVERAHTNALGIAFFDRLNKVRWTHGTGGSLAYHSEYHDEDRSVGGGGNTCTGAYGYLGIEQNPMHTRPFTNAKGQRVDVDVKTARNGYGFVGKPVVSGGGPGRGKTTAASNAGSFRSRYRGESNIRL